MATQRESFRDLCAELDALAARARDAGLDFVWCTQDPSAARYKVNSAGNLGRRIDLLITQLADFIQRAGGQVSPRGVADEVVRVAAAPTERHPLYDA